MNRKFLIIIIAGSLLAITKISLADNVKDFTQIDRYLSVANEPLAPQVDLLQQTFQIHFPTTVRIYK